MGGLLSGIYFAQENMVMNIYKGIQAVPWLFGSDSITLGEAKAKAKAATGDSDIRKTWILFGDPTTRLKWSPHGLKPVDPPHASRAEPSEAHPTTLLKSFVGYPHRIHPRSQEPWLSA